MMEVRHSLESNLGPIYYIVFKSSIIVYYSPTVEGYSHTHTHTTVYSDSHASSS